MAVLSTRRLSYFLSVMHVITVAFLLFLREISWEPQVKSPTSVGFFILLRTFSKLLGESVKTMIWVPSGES